jgi:hypothetical protein
MLSLALGVHTQPWPGCARHSACLPTVDVAALWCPAAGTQLADWAARVTLTALPELFGFAARAPSKTGHPQFAKVLDYLLRHRGGLAVGQDADGLLNICNSAPFSVSCGPLR